jgi:hypothetical protein
MPTEAYKKLAARVTSAAGEAVTAKGYATAIDVFLGVGWLTQDQLTAWKKGQIPYLERVVTANLSKISDAMKVFRVWAAHSNLKPSYTAYKHRSVDLRFSKSGSPTIETAYRTHYVLVKKKDEEA